MTEVLNLSQGTLHVVAHAHAGILVVGLAGELDPAGTSLIPALNDLDLTGISTISVDLTELEFIDSTGIQALLHLHEHQVRAGREVLFIHARPHVQRTFAILGLAGFLTV